MQEINYAAVFVSVLAAFVASVIWYIAFGKQRLALVSYSKEDELAMRRPQPLKMLAELVRAFLVAYVLAYVFVRVGVASWTSAVHIGLILWAGFPFVLLTGSVLWDKVPRRLAAIHAGDWLVKLVLISAILGAWR